MQYQTLTSFGKTSGEARRNINASCWGGRGWPWRMPVESIARIQLAALKTLRICIDGWQALDIKVICSNKRLVRHKPMVIDKFLIVNGELDGNFTRSMWSAMACLRYHGRFIKSRKYQRYLFSWARIPGSFEIPRVGTNELDVGKWRHAYKPSS